MREGVDEVFCATRRVAQPTRALLLGVSVSDDGMEAGRMQSFVPSILAVQFNWDPAEKYGRLVGHGCLRSLKLRVVML